MLFVNLMGIPVATVNWLIGSNYMYLCTKPGVDSPFLVGDWPWYLLGLEVVALLLMAIASVPMIYLRRKEQAGQILNSKTKQIQRTKIRIRNLFRISRLGFRISQRS